MSKFSSYGTGESQFSDSQVPGWYIVDRHTRGVLDGPFEDKDAANDVVAGFSERVQHWDGFKWDELQEATVDRNPNVSDEQKTGGKPQQNQSSDLHSDIAATGEDGEEFTQSDIDRLKQLAGMK